MNAGETVLITGASSGIGLELAKCFAADGSRLVLVARNQPVLEALAEELRRRHKIEVVVFPADLSLTETPARIFNELKKSGVTVDVLVNNTGFGAQGVFAGLPLQRQLEMLQVNITALTELSGLFLPGMIERRRGGILNVGSLAGFVPGPGMAVYYATKAFVLSFSEALAAELTGTGLTISVLCPGPTETNFGAVARGQRVRQLQMRKMSAEAVARAGHRDFRRGKAISVPGFKNRLLVALTRFMPRSIVRKSVGRYNQLKE